MNGVAVIRSTREHILVFRLIPQLSHSSRGIGGPVLDTLGLIHQDHCPLATSKLLDVLDQVFIVAQQQLGFRQLLVFFPIARHVKVGKLPLDLIPPRSFQVVQQAND